MLGSVLEWPITTRSTLQDALYRYDAIGRLQEANLNRQPQGQKPPEIGQFIRLGALGTAFLPRKYPRVLLIDEIDKSDIDLPNDLLHILEGGEFEIPELSRLASSESEKRNEVTVNVHGSDDKVKIVNGKVACYAFPFVVMTSNGEREFPPPFLRRCIRLQYPPLTREKLQTIVQAYFEDGKSEEERAQVAERHKVLLDAFTSRLSAGHLLATDQLLNAIFLAANGVHEMLSREDLADLVMKSLGNTGG
jgi:MoxR-like ATPase